VRKKKRKKPSAYFAKQQTYYSDQFTKKYPMGGALSYTYSYSSPEDIRVIAEEIFGHRYGYKANG